MKKPGIVQDPWQRVVAPAPEKKVEAPVEPEEDFGPVKITTVHLPGYGGISLAGSKDPRAIGPHILTFCVQHLKEIEDILTEYGVVVAKVEAGALKLPFYIRDGHGWTLSVPGATTREAGLLQLIQALLAMHKSYKISPILELYGIQAYKE